jgi:hypothetical protein
MFKPINGYTKTKMIEMIQTTMLDHPSMNGIQCAYLASDGNRCAVGVFLPNNHASLFDERDVRGLIGAHPELKGYMPLPLAAMTSLQDIHDDCPDTEDPRPELINWINNNVESEEVIHL